MLNPWLDLPFDVPYLLPIDRESLSRLTGHSRQSINLESIPEPFIGNPETATVLLLNLNPGDSPDDSQSHANPAFREALLCNLRHAQQDYPFYALNPEFRWTACAKWWTTRLRQLLKHPALERQKIARLLCVIEWFPYHSKVASLPRTMVCPSQQYCFDIVRKAIGSKKVIIGMRARKRWADVDARLGEVPYLKNPRSPYITPCNAAESLFSQIVEALK